MSYMRRKQVEARLVASEIAMVFGAKRAGRGKVAGARKVSTNEGLSRMGVSI